MGERQLASRTGLPLASIEAWIRGDAPIPDNYLLTLAAALNQVAGEATVPGPYERQ